MTTTAFDDQYLDAPDPVREPMSREAVPAPAVLTDEQWWVDQLDTITGCFEKLTMDQYRAVHIARQFIKAVLTSVPVPAVPTDEQIHAVYRNALGQSIRERDMPEIRKFAHALMQSPEVTK